MVFSVESSIVHDFKEPLKDLELPAVALETGCEQSQKATAFYDSVSDPQIIDQVAERQSETLVHDTIFLMRPFRTFQPRGAPRRNVFF